MRMSVFSLAAIAATLAFGAEAAPLSAPRPATPQAVESGLVQHVDYWCGPGWRMTPGGVCAPWRYYGPPPYWRHHHHHYYRPYYRPRYHHPYYGRPHYGHREWRHGGHHHYRR